jgi:type IV pilus assembly protein PilW
MTSVPSIKNSQSGQKKHFHVTDIDSGYVQKNRGFSLIELMVGLSISLLGTLIIFNVYSANERYRRTTVSGNDALMNGAFASYRIDQLLKMSGSGLGIGDKTQSIHGCPLNVWKSGTAIVPGTYPAPFDSIVTVPIVAAPAVIIDGGASGADALMIIGSQSSARTAMIPLDTAPNTLSIGVISPIGIRRNDLLLAAEQDTTQLYASGVRKPCRLAQVSSTAILSGDFVTEPFPIAGSYTPTSGFGTGYSASTRLVNLGNAPRTSVIAIGADPVNGQTNSLLEFDYLQRENPAVKSIAENVVDIQAIYGIATNISDTHVSSWQSPGTSPWNAASLTAGTNTAIANLQLIRAVRIAVITRSAKKETEQVTASPLNYFSDLSGLSITKTLTADEQKYRYKVFDVTIPIRNMGT